VLFELSLLWQMETNVKPKTAQDEFRKNVSKWRKTMSTLYSIGQMNQLGDALENSGYTPADVETLRKFDLNQFRFVLTGQAKIVAVVKKVAEKVKKTLKPFITIATGGMTADKLIADIKAMPAEVGEYAESMTKNSAFTVSKTVGTADLVAMTIAELGFTASPRTDEFMTPEFCARWSAENLDGAVIELCQPEDGPQLRKQWKDQPKGTAVWMAMERIADSDGSSDVWHVERHSDGRLWLRGFWMYSDISWNLGYAIVFRFRKI
jgi:hypothetical protein